jgi:putative tryptophan/tyrosine transport system permease protein
MIPNYLLVIATEGLIFGLFAYGVFLSFQWLRFPDLTPDGSFVLGGCVYVRIAGAGFSPLLALFLACLAGALSGAFTAALNRFLKVPPVIAGLLTSIALYSVGWVILAKPNQFLENSETLVGNSGGARYNVFLLVYVVAIVVLVTAFLALLSESIWGLRLKAIGENPLIVTSITRREPIYYVLLLALSNGVVATSGGLFVQRSFSADVNMGVGQTIVGLIAMIIGMLLASFTRKSSVILLSILLGSIFYKAVMFAILVFGLPAEYFRLASALALIVLFSVMRKTKIDLLKGLRWN